MVEINLEYLVPSMGEVWLHQWEITSNYLSPLLQVGF